MGFLWYDVEEKRSDGEKKRMAYDVFISYSNQNKAVADAICARLEQDGIRCWYAPRDIQPGEIWAESIIRAIRTVKIMIVVFTDESNKSPQVLNEITNAVSAGVTIVPFKMTKEPPSASLQYFFANVHWLDAVDEPLNQSIESLCEKVRPLVQPEAATPIQASPPPKTPETPRKPQKPDKPGKSRLPLILASAALVVVLIVAGLALSGKLGRGEEEEIFTPRVTAAPTQAPAATPTAKPTSVPTATPNNQSYLFQPKGVAYISDGKDTFVAPVSSLYTIYYAEIVHGMKFLRGSGSKLPAFDKIASMEMSDYGDGNEYHRAFRVTCLDGSVMETDVQTAWSTLHFMANDVHVSRDWYKLESIRFDHEGSCLTDWPEYARLYLRNGNVIVVPAFTLNAATHKRPSENTINYDHKYEWPSTVKTERGYEIDFSEVRSLVFGEGTFKADKLSDIWVEGIKPGWISSLPVAILFRDGRTLTTAIAEDYLIFFAIDEFGKVEVRPDRISRIDFVADLTEPVNAPELP